MAKGLSQRNEKPVPPKPKNVTPEQQFAPKDDIQNEPDIVIQEEQQAENKQPEKNTPEVPEPKSEEKNDEFNGSKEEPKQEPPQTPETPQKSDIVVVEAKEYTELEKQYIQRLEDIREQINNPTPINRLNKRRRYTGDRRRNVTFSIREDISYLMDDLVDDAKIFKGLFQDEVIHLGIKSYIDKYGIK